MKNIRFFPCFVSCFQSLSLSIPTCDAIKAAVIFVSAAGNTGPKTSNEFRGGGKLVKVDDDDDDDVVDCDGGGGFGRSSDWRLSTTRT